MTTELPAIFYQVQAGVEELYYEAFEAGRLEGFAQGLAAARDALNQLTAISAIQPAEPTTPRQSARTPTLPPETSIGELNLTVRTYTALTRQGVHSISALLDYSEADLLDLPRFGQKSIDDVRAKLGAVGYALRGETLA